MGFQGNLPAQHRNPAFLCKIFLKVFPLLHSPAFPLPVIPGFEQFPSQHPGYGHAGGRALTLSGIIDLGILSESHFHGRRSLHKDIVNPSAMGFDQGELPSHHIGTAGAHHSRRDACPHRIIEGSIHAVDGVYSPQPGRNGIHCLIAVVSLHALFFLGDSHMAVRLDNARHHPAAACVQYLVRAIQFTARRIRMAHFLPLFHGSHPGYFAIFHPDRAVFYDALRPHGMNLAVNDLHIPHMSLLI